MKIIKKWHAREFLLGDISVRVKLKAMEKNEAPVFLKGMAALTKDEMAVSDGAEGKLDQLSEMLAAFDSPFVRDSFERFVRVDDEVQAEGGQPVTSGGELYDVATPGFVMAVLMELQHLCVVTVHQGKGSPSPSTSSAATATGSGSSAATSIGSADGPAPSGATDQTGAESSSSVSAPQ